MKRDNRINRIARALVFAVASAAAFLLPRSALGQTQAGAGTSSTQAPNSPIRLGQTGIGHGTISQASTSGGAWRPYIATDGPYGYDFWVLTPTGNWEVRTPPQPHATSHATGGSDVITPLMIGAAPAVHTHDASAITSGTLSAARLPLATISAPGIVTLAAAGGTTAGTAVQATDARLSDARIPLAHTHTLSQIVDAGTAATRSVPVTGNATATQVVLGSDSRLLAVHQLQAFRVTIPSIGLGLTAAQTITLPYSYTDALYTVVCTAQTGSGISLIDVVGIGALSSTNFTVTLKNVSLSGAASGTLHVFILHD